MSGGKVARVPRVPRVPNIRTGFKVGVLVWEAPDGLWYWREIRAGSVISGGFETRERAVADCTFYCGDRYLWPEIIGPEDLRRRRR